jgi:hypothetical protein
LQVHVILQVCPLPLEKASGRALPAKMKVEVISMKVRSVEMKVAKRFFINLIMAATSMLWPLPVNGTPEM